MPDSVLIRKKKSQECSQWANINCLLPVPTEQGWSGCAEHGDMALPGKLLHECHSSWMEQWEGQHGHTLKGMSQLPNSAFCYKQSPDTTSLSHCKNDVWLQSLAWKRKGLNSFQLNFPPALRLVWFCSLQSRNLPQSWWPQTPFRYNEGLETLLSCRSSSLFKPLPSVTDELWPWSTCFSELAVKGAWSKKLRCRFLMHVSHSLQCPN